MDFKGRDFKYFWGLSPSLPNFDRGSPPPSLLVDCWYGMSSLYFSLLIIYGMSFYSCMYYTIGIILYCLYYGGLLEDKPLFLSD